MSCNCQKIAEEGKEKVEESLAMAALRECKAQAKRWFVAWALTFILLLSVIGGIVFIVLTSDIRQSDVDLTADNGIANYIGNDGDISNGENTRP